jgi:hypothetical protein
VANNLRRKSYEFQVSRHINEVYDAYCKQSGTAETSSGDQGRHDLYRSDHHCRFHQPAAACNR